ncbi:MAG: ROK family protein [Clostridiales Family XIII bacterium]|jgi:glucokinase|nr:ROK family protein [Clostridiales Family XIII bacterium]
MLHNIGIDLGGTNIAVGLVREDNRILSQRSAPTKAGRSPEEILHHAAQLARETASDANIEFSTIHSIGFVSTGIANQKTRRLEFSANLFWDEADVGGILTEETGKPIFLDNDANGAALGEHVAGAAKDYNISLMLTIGTGIGGGLVIHDRVFRGFNYAGMEIGHMVIERDGRPCHCGRRGCYERYASASGLILTAEESMRDIPSSLLWTLCEHEVKKLTGRMVFDAADQGDPTAVRVLDTFIKDLSCGVVSLVNIFQPEILVIGGGPSAQGDRIFEPLRTALANEAYSRQSPRNTKVVGALLGNDAGIIGAANLWRETHEDE